jgi:hypothetical protein
VAEQVIAALQSFFAEPSQRDGGAPPVLSNQDSRP